MNYNTVYVGMDVHKESFTFCAYTIDAEKGSRFQRTEADYKNVLRYLEFLRTVYGNDANFICGYEAGCLGYTLYHQLTEHHVNCVILAPTTILLSYLRVCSASPGFDIREQESEKPGQAHQKLPSDLQPQILRT